ncbi:DUF3291 domain-containing protein [Fodinicola feengrottensis]|uniref:DUF3291 domain-containing protein n=1 Tax=Fodinicola feengrottensis TaxID=435914 RepID=A0ABN2HHS2_9ACTN|nr:DUF3291 domain-containing protein [Fodinicola feengrottensis]
MAYELAQVNFSRLLAPLESPQLADFVAGLEPVNALADAAPGFLWRMQTEDGDATAIRAFQWDVGDSAGIIVNMSVWTSVEALADFVYSGDHLAALRRRREWFAKIPVPATALWWVPTGHRPTTDDAEDRVRHLRLHGPTAYTFTLKQHFPTPEAAPAVVREGDPGWLCPA